MSKRITTCLVIMSISYFMGCSVPRKEISIDIINYDVKPGEVIIITPKIKYEYVDNTNPHVNDPNSMPEISRWLIKIVEHALLDKGFKAILQNYQNIGTNSKKQINSQNRISLLSDRFVRQSISKDEINILKDECHTYGGQSFLFMNVVVKIGNNDKWLISGLPPISFQFTPRTKQSNSYIRAIIRDCSSGEYLWKNDVFLRELPRVNSPIFEEKIRKLFVNLISIP